MMNVNRQPPALGEILFLSGPRKGETFRVTKARTGIGRQPDPGNDLIVPEASVSRFHAEIILDNGVWRINKLSANNTLFINKQPVQQGGAIRSQNVSGLGPDVELLFLSLIPEKKPDPATAPTVYRPQQPVSGVNQGQPSQPALPASDDPFKNPGHPAWQSVGIFTGVGGIIIALEAPIPSMGVTLQVITAAVTLFLCASIVLRARRVALSPQGAARKLRFTGRKALLYSLLLNITLVIVSTITIILAFVAAFSGGQQTAANALAISFLVFLAGILISFITAVVQIFILLHKKLLAGGRVLWITAGITALAVALDVLASKMNLSGNASLIIGLPAYTLSILGSESFLIFILVGPYLLARLIARLFSSPSKVSTP